MRWLREGGHLGRQRRRVGGYGYRVWPTRRAVGRRPAKSVSMEIVRAGRRLDHWIGGSNSRGPGAGEGGRMMDGAGSGTYRPRSEERRVGKGGRAVGVRSAGQ